MYIIIFISALNKSKCQSVVLFIKITWVNLKRDQSLKNQATHGLAVFLMILLTKYDGIENPQMC